MDLINYLLHSHIELTLPMIIFFSFVLGVIHGFTPDEHTWPITFSYAVGSYSAKKGLVIGFAFSLAFTVQRALASELANLALFPLTSSDLFEYGTYVLVGLAMVFGGFYVFRTKNVFHIHFGKIDKDHHRMALRGAIDREHKLSVRIALLHGFIAGWGFGAFALVLYTVLAPQIQSHLLGWVPGAFFGLGTMITQVILGAFFGFITTKIGLPIDVARFAAQRTAARTLIFGGAAFFLVGLLGLFDMVYNPPYLNVTKYDLGFVLVVFSVFVVGLLSLFYEYYYYKIHFR
ncbi:hypothetical protein TDSAC_0363 [Thermodesulfobium acidiphilum]|uniref:Urease accessory protein UreH-like transmembrane domain-containing protein n=1 Tax=Thermodesulfobium acidiphilum TaxID=1794699 RepID=A0A2R4VYW8_THEAF|nr:hypothetical protein [Thermodesulfobium acidiphilum]AWB09739.1 hypothetical protein TDSAC_0363 [Thermodesulfobium acidiphilum]